MAIREILMDYLHYILIAGIIFVFYYIYSKQPSHQKVKIKKIFTKRNIFKIVIVLIWLYWHFYGGISTIRNSTRWMPIIALLYLSASQMWEAIKYKTPQLVGPNFHGSFSKLPLEQDGFYIFALDSISSNGITWDYAGRIIVLRKETCHLFLRGGVTIAPVRIVDKEDLESPIRKLIENNKFLKDAQEEIYFGYFDDLNRVDWTFEQLKKLEEEDKDFKKLYGMLKEELKIGNPSIKILMEAYLNQCKVSNTTDKQFSNAIKIQQTGGEHDRVMRDIYGDPKKKQDSSEGFEDV